MRPMKKLIASTLLALGLSIAVTGTAAADGPKHPTPAQVQAYQCAVEKTNKGPCQNIPGFWNDWAGKTTPARWDPCMADRGAGLIYGQPCTRRSVSFKTWCSLHFDHRLAGWNLCGPKLPWT